MCTQKRVRKQDVTPAQVVIPRITETEVRSRATRAYDAVMGEMLSGRQRELTADLEALRSSITSDQRSLPIDASETQRSERLMDSIEDFMRERPDSPLTAWLNTLDDLMAAVPGFDYSYDRRGLRLSLRLDSSAPEQYLRRPFTAFRDNIIGQIVRASEPVPAGESLRLLAPLFEYARTASEQREFTEREARGEAPFRMDSALAQQFATALMARLGIGPQQSVPRGHLPIRIALQTSYTYQMTRPPGEPSRELTVFGPTLALSYAGPRPAGRITVSRKSEK